MPPATANNCREQIIEALNEADYRKTQLLFSVVQLYENLRWCAILISSAGIEITPPFIPTGRFSFFAKIYGGYIYLLLWSTRPIL
jgi:hypothetical protein